MSGNFLSFLKTASEHFHFCIAVVSVNMPRVFFKSACVCLDSVVAFVSVLMLRVFICANQAHLGRNAVSGMYMSLSFLKTAYKRPLFYITLGGVCVCITAGSFSSCPQINVFS